MERLVADLLMAAFNIGPGVEPGDDAGVALTNAAIETGSVLGRLADLDPDSKAGAIIAAKVFLEIATAPDPKRYAETEIERGWEGERFENINAGRTITIG